MKERERGIKPPHHTVHSLFVTAESACHAHLDIWQMRTDGLSAQMWEMEPGSSLAAETELFPNILIVIRVPVI